MGGVAAGMCTGPRLSWSVRSPGFPQRDTRGNPGDRFLSIEISRSKCGWETEKRDVTESDLSISF